MSQVQIPWVLKAQNKKRQYAPTGPDVKTAARFRRRCAWRYVLKGEIDK